jgi:hypothetical protein
VRSYTRAWQQIDAELRAEADAEFTETRLDRQYASIMRRLAQHGRPARVLAFPGSVRPPLASRHGARRWVAAAAVVGLLVGMAAGRFIDDNPLKRQLARSSVRAPVSPIAQPGSELPLDAGETNETKGSDEAFLVELDVAAATPRIEPLLALDAMTPRLREAVGSGR